MTAALVCVLTGEVALTLLPCPALHQICRGTGQGTCILYVLMCSVLPFSCGMQVTSRYRCINVLLLNSSVS